MRVLHRHGLTWGPSLDGHHSRLLDARGRCRYRNCRAIVARIAATRLEIATDGRRLDHWPFTYNEASAGHVRFRVRSRRPRSRNWCPLVIRFCCKTLIETICEP